MNDKKIPLLDLNRIKLFIAQEITILQYDWGHDLYDPSHLQN